MHNITMQGDLNCSILPILNEVRVRGRATIDVTLPTFFFPLNKQLGIWTPINLYTINGIIDSVSASFSHVKFVEPESNHFLALSLTLIQSQINALVIVDFIM